MAIIKFLEGEGEGYRERMLKGSCGSTKIWTMGEVRRSAKPVERKWSCEERGSVIEFPLMKALLSGIPPMTPSPFLWQNIESIIRFEKRRDANRPPRSD